MNAVSPGSIETPLLNSVLSEQQSKQFLGSVLKSTSMGRMGTANKVAKAVLFLASDDSSYITGYSTVC
jgi:meso-butanediol dehydrogenase/(S,S)-butanediol dehydrogenase/diacetyl reductase